ncbi:MAG: excinuclease ABC subunit UvrC [Trichlorobacter sp.]
METKEKLRNTTRDFPASPGVYLMHAQDNSILYVGKARNLRQRVANYFTTHETRSHITFLMARVHHITYLLTDTEQEALLLENTLIKKHQPRYNLNLKDDKTYFSLRIDPREDYPRLTTVRQRATDGARYFGPYASSSAAREVATQIVRIFKLIRYPWGRCLQRKRPCLYYEIGQCSAPCHGHISQKEYRQAAHDAISFLSGDASILIKDFKQRMNQASNEQRYEDAARWRDVLNAIHQTLEPQKVIQEKGDIDCIGIARDNQQHVITVLHLRKGIVCGSENVLATGTIPPDDALESFISQYYTAGRELPDEVCIPIKLDSLEELTTLLKEQKKSSIRITAPSRGKKKELVELATRNAVSALTEAAQRSNSCEQILTELQNRLKLPVSPQHIECYDISNIQGTFSVGSGVAFSHCKPDTTRYRRYRIQNVAGQNDFAMLQEVLGRRFSDKHIVEWGVPDLIVIDGGAGQLQAVRAVLSLSNHTKDIPVVGLAKSRVSRDAHGQNISRSEERVFLVGRRNPVTFKQGSKAIMLLAQIRDEAHRFAIEYHRGLRSKALTTSVLRSIPGIGKKTEVLLLEHFKSIARLKTAPAEAIAALPGLNSAKASLILSFLNTHKDSPS